MTYDDLLKAMFPEGQEITQEHIQSILDRYEAEKNSGLHELELERDSLREDLQKTAEETEKIRGELDETKKLNFKLARKIDVTEHQPDPPEKIMADLFG